MDNEMREWLEGFEKRLNTKFEFMEGWLRGELDEMRAEIAGFRAETNHGFATVRRDLQNLDRRVSRLEQTPVAAE